MSRSETNAAIVSRLADCVSDTMAEGEEYISVDSLLCVIAEETMRGSGFLVDIGEASFQVLGVEVGSAS